jgi:Tol biopolymer transport system component/DNA-binding winged helix-turn-helix (wHTH) protein
MEPERNADDPVMAPVAYEFGDFRVDLRTMSLSRHGEIVPVEPKVFDVLCRLIEHRDRVLTKDELLDLAWVGTFVTPNALTRAVAQLRKALADDAGEARFIATLSKRGYRWIAPVVVIHSAAAESKTPAVAPVDPVAPAVPAAATTAAPEAARRLPLRALAGALVVGLIVVAVAWAWKRADTKTLSVPRTESTPTRLTVRSGYDGMPALSTDGRIAYASDAGGALEIWITGSTPGSRATALTSDGGQNTDPAWSPDGQWIAFSSIARGGIWVVPSTGGTPRQVAEVGSEPAWSPDSASIVFSSNAGGMAWQSTLMIVGRDGTGLRALTRIGAPPGGHREPSFAPDGQHVAFVVFGNGGWIGELWIARVADGALSKVLTHNGARWPQFDAGGTYLYWLSFGDLWRVPIDTTSQPRGAFERILDIHFGSLEDWSMTPSGQVAFSVVDDDANLWVVDTDASAPEPRRLTNQEVRTTYPSIGPDGRVLYVQMVPNQGLSAWLTDLHGTTPEHLADGLSRAIPQWSADGRRILLRHGPLEDGVFGWLDLATRRITDLTVPAVGVINATLSPDNREIAYHRIAGDGPTRGSLNVFVRPLDGGAETQLSFDREAVSYPVWSPDGRSLAVEVKRGARTHVGVILRGGGAVRLLTHDAGQSFVSTWSADGEWIIFAGERGSVWNVFGVSPRTGQVRAFTHFTPSIGYVRYPAISRDGAQIVFERNMFRGNLWTTEVQ